MDAVSLPRYRKRRISPNGKASERKRPVRRVEYEAVSRRAKGVCEMPLCSRKQDPLDPHHAFGRGHLPGIPAELCETRELILGVCRVCHDSIHAGNQELLNLARRQAIERFAVHHGLISPRVERQVRVADGERLLDVMRDLVRDYDEQEGVTDYARPEIKREREAGGPI